MNTELCEHEVVFVYAGGVSRPEITSACVRFLARVRPGRVLWWGLAPEAVAELAGHLPPGVLCAPAGSDGDLFGALAGLLDTSLSAPAPAVVFGAAAAHEVLALMERSEPASAGGPGGTAVRVTLFPGDVDLRREAVAFALLVLHDLTGILRAECPWDRRQTQRDIVSYTLEEAYELVDTIRAEPVIDSAVRGELGDLLFQVYFLAKVAEQEGAYDLGSVARGIHDKLVRRHPHIFGEVEAPTADDVKKNWDEIKRTTEGRVGIFHEVPDSLPSTLFAQKLQQRAAGVGFDWDDIVGPLEKVREELAELVEVLECAGLLADGAGMGAEEGAEESADSRLSADGRLVAEMGDVLFAIINLARRLRVDPELALREASRRFRGRVEGAAALAAGEGIDFARLDLEAQESYYQKAKAQLSVESDRPER